MELGGTRRACHCCAYAGLEQAKGCQPGAARGPCLLPRKAARPISARWVENQGNVSLAPRPPGKKTNKPSTTGSRRARVTTLQRSREVKLLPGEDPASSSDSAGESARYRETGRGAWPWLRAQLPGKWAAAAFRKGVLTVFGVFAPCVFVLSEYVDRLLADCRARCACQCF